MKLGVLTVPLYGMPLAEALSYLAGLGVQAVEIGTGGYPGKGHCDPSSLLADEKALEAFCRTIQESGLEISALSCHGNPLHPQKDIAKKYHEDFCQTILLAEKLGVKRMVGFSGCPGDCPESRYPNWVTCAWPEDYLAVLEYQWNEVLIPYWKDMADFAQAHGVEKICFEMHPGFCVYNPETLLQLRAAVGPIIGANYDPSHLIWQGMDPVEALRTLGDAVYYVHGKDVRLDQTNIAKNGVLDTKHYGDLLGRAWIFRTMGYGHDTKVWKDIISMLKVIGYDDVVSIEHEDALMSPKEGLEKAIDFLKDVLIQEQAGAMWWA